MTLAERYIRLAHHIDAHEPGFVDGYGGPPEWAERTVQPLDQLLREAEALQKDLAQLAQAERRSWLAAQLRAMTIKLRLLAGEALNFREEVEGLYDIVPVPTAPELFDEALETFQSIVPGQGPLPERLAALRQRVSIPPEKLLALAERILPELRRRTAERFGLAQGEHFSMALVQNQPWSAYNWPLGNLQSRIDLNTDLPVLLPNLPDLLAHEAYPGHHTEHSSKEERLVRQYGWQEHSMQLINAPECVVSEGIATHALRMVMSEAEELAWLTGELAALAGLEPSAVEQYRAVQRAQGPLRSLRSNAAWRLHQEGRPEQEVLAFLSHYSGGDQGQAGQVLRFIQNPVFRAYLFTYSAGYELVGAYCAQHGAADFQQLLHQPLTPGQLRRG